MRQSKPDPSGEETKSLVVTSEDGVVLTGQRALMFEARVMASARKPYIVMGMLQLMTFVILLGLGIFASNLNDAVKDTHVIVREATGAKGQLAQAETIRQFVSTISCENQKNLQKFADALAAGGSKPAANAPDFVDERCQNTPALPDSTTTTQTSSP